MLLTSTCWPSSSWSSAAIAELSTGAFAGLDRSCSRMTSPSFRPAPETAMTSEICSHPAPRQAQRARLRCGRAQRGMTRPSAGGLPRPTCACPSHNRYGDIVGIENGGLASEQATLVDLPGCSILLLLRVLLPAADKELPQRPSGSPSRSVGPDPGMIRTSGVFAPASSRVPASGPCGP